MLEVDALSPGAAAATSGARDRKCLAEAQGSECIPNTSVKLLAPPSRSADGARAVPPEVCSLLPWTGTMSQLGHVLRHRAPA